MLSVAYYDSYDKELLFCMGVWYLQPTYYLSSFINTLTMDTTMDASIRNPNPIFYMIEATCSSLLIPYDSQLLSVCTQ